MAVCLGADGRYAEAEEHFRQVRDLDSNFVWAHYYLAELYAARQMFGEALPIAERAHALGPWSRPSAGLYGGLLARLGEQDRGQRGNPEAGFGRCRMEHQQAWRSTTSAAVKSTWPRTGSRKRSKNDTPMPRRSCRARSGNRCAPARDGRNEPPC